MSSPTLISLSELLRSRYAIFKGEANVVPPVLYEAIYELRPPLTGLDDKSYSFVLIRGVRTPQRSTALIYGLNDKKEIDTHIELPGSVEKTAEHAHALDLAGYQYILDEDPLLDEVG
jgi:hypothetical protein